MEREQPISSCSPLSLSSSKRDYDTLDWIESERLVGLVDDFVARGAPLIEL